MRKLPLLALAALAACGPSRSGLSFPRYAVVTTIPESDPLHREIDVLVDHRGAEIFHAKSLVDDRAELEDWLRDFQPDHVAAVVRPEELTPANAARLVDALCRLDDDPFPDAALGWFLAADAAFLRRQIQVLRGAEAKVEKRLLHSTVLRPGAGAERVDRLEWAQSLPVKRLDVPPGESPFLQARLPALERCDYLLLGTPPLRGLRLDSVIVFSELSGSASPFRPWLSDLLQAGAAAVLAPLGEARAADAEREWADAIATDVEIGEVWRRSAEFAVLSGAAPSARLLFGCPRLDAYTRPARAPWKVVSVRRDGDALVASVQVRAADNPVAFGGTPGTDRAHVRIPLPPDSARVRVVEARGEAQGKAVAVEAAAAVVEHRLDGDRAHVLLRGATLAVDDLFVTLRLQVE
jgi:hypothetical protein